MVWPFSSAKCEAPPEIRKITYSGSGWLFNYQLGVSQALRDVGAVRPGLFVPGEPEKPQTRMVGASGGALAAASSALDIDSDVARNVAITMWDKAAADPRLKFRLDILLDTGLEMFKEQFETAPQRWHAKNGDCTDNIDSSDKEAKQAVVAVALGTAEQQAPKSCTCGAAEFNATLAKGIERDLAQGHDTAAPEEPTKLRQQPVAPTKFPRTWEDVARGRLAVHFGTFLSSALTSYAVAVRSDYASFVDGKETLIASCMVPGFTGRRVMNSSPAQVDLDRAGESSAGIQWNTFPPGFDTSKPIVEVDGGIPPNFQPEAERARDVINVTPIWAARWLPFWPADITPRYIPMGWMLFPPMTRESYADLYTYGYRDGVQFAASKGFVSTERALELEAAAGCTDPAMLNREPSRAYHALKTVLVVGAVGAAGRFLVMRSPLRRAVDFFKSPSRG